MISTGEIAGLWMFPVGVMIGLLFSLIPVSIIALIPGPKLVYHGERDERTDNTVSSITPYIGGQGEYLSCSRLARNSNRNKKEFWRIPLRLDQELMVLAVRVVCGKSLSGLGRGLRLLV